VKGCGKSAPPGRQRPGHGKPRREQNRIGATEGLTAFNPSPGRRPGWLLEAVGDDRPRGMAVTSRRATGAATQNPAYRPAGALFRPHPGRRQGSVNSPLILTKLNAVWRHSGAAAPKAVSSSLARIPIGRERPIDPNSRQINRLEQILVEKVCQFFRKSPKTCQWPANSPRCDM
jgi:hypothetical protein